MNKLLYTIFCVLTAIIGFNIHGSFIWSIVDFFFAPFAWIKWLIFHEVTWSIIKGSFMWFFV